MLSSRVPINSLLKYRKNKEKIILQESYTISKLSQSFLYIIFLLYICIRNLFLLFVSFCTLAPWIRRELEAHKVTRNTLIFSKS
jgi:hypothetical protein